MKEHTNRTVVPVLLALLAVCLLVAPAFAQTSNPPIIQTDFNVDLVQGILTVQAPDGQVLSTQNDLSVSTALVGDLETQMIGDPNLDLSAYATANLPSMIGSEDNFTFLNVIANPNAVPSLLLTSQGNIINGPDFTDPLNAMYTDLTGNSPISGTVTSTTIQGVGNDQFFVEGFSGNQEIEGIINVNYDTYNIVEVTPEAGSLVLLLAGLAGLGLCACARRSKTV